MIYHSNHATASPINSQLLSSSHSLTASRSTTLPSRLLSLPQLLALQLQVLEAVLVLQLDRALCITYYSLQLRSPSFAGYLHATLFRFFSRFFFSFGLCAGAVEKMMNLVTVDLMMITECGSLHANSRHRSSRLMSGLLCMWGRCGASPLA